MTRIGCFVLAIVCSCALARAGAEMRSENFDKDPAWDAFQNRIPPKDGKTVKQDFGYRETNLAGKANGEIGGTIWPTGRN